MNARARTTFGDAAILGALSSAIMALVTIVRSKVTALVLGPEGFGVTGEVMQYPMLASTLVAIVAGTALSSKLAAAHGRGDSEGARRIYSTAVTALLALSVPGGIVATLVVGVLLAGAHGEVVWLYGLLSVFGLFGATLAGIPALVLAARGEAKAALSVSLVAGVVPGVVSVGLVYYGGLLGQFLALAVTSLLGLALALPLAARILPDFSWRPRWSMDRGYLREAVSIGGASLLGGLLLQWVLVLVRNLLIDRGGSALLGQFQASWAAGSAYLGLVLGGVASFAFPRYAAATTAQQLGQEVEAGARFVLRIAPPVIFLAIAGCDLLITALYSERFAPATHLLAWQLAGDLPKALAWVIGGPLLYRGKVRAYLAAEVFFALTFGLGAWVCIPRFGLEGVGYAYVLAYAAFLPLVWGLLWSSCGVRARPAFVAGMLALTAMGLGLVLGVRTWPGTRAIAVILALGWWWRTGTLASAVERVRSVVRRLRLAPVGE